MNKNKRRQRLKYITLSCFLLILAVFSYIIVRGATWSPPLSNSAEKLDVPVGETHMHRIKGQRFWVTRLSAQQLRQLEGLSEWVQVESSCELTLGLCAVDANTERFGVSLRYSANLPDVLTDDIPWFGGYINPNNGSVYDLLGRGYLRNSAAADKLLPRVVLEGL